MCGIAGILRQSPGAALPARDELERMIAALAHRGPDEHGLYRDERCGLGHARLSIIDLSTGQQPMSNEDGSLWITFNGEIFDYVELREELEALGHRFRTASDTEVVLHAWEAWGEEAFGRFDGQWALALWDARRGELVLSRDHVGINPLYTLEHAGRLYFASEVRAIFAADPSIPRELDPRGLAETFTFWSVVPPQSVFCGVTELPPGHLRVYRDGSHAERAWWTLRFPEGAGGARAFAGGAAEATERVRSALEDATRLRMLRADVPVGSYLSGGLDSSLVAALAHQVIDDRLITFSLRFEDAEYDETGYQRLMIERLGSRHREIVVSRDDIARAFPAAVVHAERPILRTAPTPMFLLSKLVHDAGIKVVLTGEGADEMFAGYDLFREGVVRRFWARHPESTLRPRLLERLYPYLSRSPVAQQAMARQFFGRDLDRAAEPGFAHRTRWDSSAPLMRLLGADLREATRAMDVAADLLASLPPDLRRWHPLAQDQYLEVRTLLAGYLLSSQGDRMLMAHSVEGRFPFLDPHVIALAASLPPEHKLRVLDEKHVLKRVGADLLPEAILRRPKQPYRAPDALSFVGASAPAWVTERLDEGAVRDAGVFDPRGVAALWQKCRRHADDGQFSNADNMALVGVLSTQILHRELIHRAPSGEGELRLRTLVDRLAPNAA